VARPSSSTRRLHPIEETARRFCSGASGDTEHPGARINAFPPVVVFVRDGSSLSRGTD